MDLNKEINVSSLFNFLKEWVSTEPLFHPNTWVRNRYYSKAANRRLKDLMRKYSFEYSGDYITKIGGEIYWIENHPYDSFHRHTNQSEGLPSRRTVLKARKKYEQDVSI